MVLNYIVGYNKMQKEQQLFRMYIEIKVVLWAFVVCPPEMDPQSFLKVKHFLSMNICWKREIELYFIIF